MNRGLKPNLSERSFAVSAGAGNALHAIQVRFPFVRRLVEKLLNDLPPGASRCNCCGSYQETPRSWADTINLIAEVRPLLGFKPIGRAVASNEIGGTQFGTPQTEFSMDSGDSRSATPWRRDLIRAHSA